MLYEATVVQLSCANSDVGVLQAVWSALAAMSFTTACSFASICWLNYHKCGSAGLAK
jgi:hypothetical protein